MFDAGEQVSSVLLVVVPVAIGRRGAAFAFESEDGDVVGLRHSQPGIDKGATFEIGVGRVGIQDVRGQIPFQVALIKVLDDGVLTDAALINAKVVPTGRCLVIKDRTHTAAHAFLILRDKVSLSLSLACSINGATGIVGIELIGSEHQAEADHLGQEAGLCHVESGLQRDLDGNLVGGQAVVRWLALKTAVEDLRQVVGGRPGVLGQLDLLQDVVDEYVPSMDFGSIGAQLTDHTTQPRACHRALEEFKVVLYQYHLSIDIEVESADAAQQERDGPWCLLVGSQRVREFERHRVACLPEGV
ncbi:hypothetical protein PG990_010498 [Apiospora arundinis]